MLELGLSHMQFLYKKHLGSDKALTLRMLFWSVCNMLMSQKVSKECRTFSAIN